jgi:predicted XRE-type DNA-binding protein
MSDAMNHHTEDQDSTAAPATAQVTQTPSQPSMLAAQQDAVEKAAAVAAGLKLALIDAILGKFESIPGMTTAQKTAILQTTPSRVGELNKKLTEKFSLDVLVRFAVLAEINVRLTLG